MESDRFQTVQYAVAAEAEVGECLWCQNAGAMHRLANCTVLLYQLDLIACLGQESTRMQPSRPTAHDNNVDRWSHQNES